MLAFSCDYCNFSCENSSRFFKHLVHFHSNEPNFKVYCRNCPRSFTKVNSLQKHFYRDHRHVNDNNHDDNSDFDDDPNDSNGLENCDQNREQENGIETTSKDLTHHVAKFLLCVKEKGRVTQSALDMVKDSTKNLLDEYFNMVKNVLVTKLQSEVGQQFRIIT